MVTLIATLQFFPIDIRLPIDNVQLCPIPELSPICSNGRSAKRAAKKK
jgi:hypothetical protein